MVSKANAAQRVIGSENALWLIPSFSVETRQHFFNTSASGTTNVSGSLQLKATALIQSDETTGVCIKLQVANQGNASTRNWQLTFAPNQAAITQAWGGNFLPQGTKYLVVPESGQQVIQPNQTVVGGYCASK